MIPKINQLSTFDLPQQARSSRSHKMEIETDVIHGTVEELEAVKQAVYKILNTERYQFPIYSHDFGVEIMDLYGKPLPFVCAELERRIGEAVVQDDRVLSVENFSFNRGEKNKLMVTFMVKCIFGDFASGKAVDV